MNDQYQVMHLPEGFVCEWLVIDMNDQTDFEMFDIEAEAKAFAADCNNTH